MHKNNKKKKQIQTSPISCVLHYPILIDIFVIPLILLRLSNMGKIFTSLVYGTVTDSVIILICTCFNIYLFILYWFFVCVYFVIILKALVEALDFQLVF